MKVGIIGIGFVGSAIRESFLKHNIDLICYDKYNPSHNDTLADCLNTTILFLCLPTPFSSTTGRYDKTVINDLFDYLNTSMYKGSVVLKSTVEPGVTGQLANKFNNLNIIHNPEFLTARTAFEDFHSQKHIVIGKTSRCSHDSYMAVVDFYNTHYPRAEVTQCTSLESESAKIFANSFYAVKVQFFTELYLLCEKIGCDYSKARDIMLKNNWINPMHTTIPGPDGEISYGGDCFPKDTNALNGYMKDNETANSILQACISERDTLRSDNNNCS